MKGGTNIPSNFTENYNLSQWEPEDKVLRGDFNEDNRKIDAAIKAVDVRVDGKADASALAKEISDRAATVAGVQDTLSSLQSTVAEKQDASGAVKIKAGSYTGDGAASRTISVGFTPKAVLVTDRQGVTYLDAGASSSMIGGLAVTGSPLTFTLSNTTYPVLEVTANGFIVHYQTFPGYYNIITNGSGTTYNYLAIG